MQDTFPTYANLPIVLQWSAGMLTVFVGVMLMIWAAKRWLPPTPIGRDAPGMSVHNQGQPLSVYSTQVINDPQFLQLIISGQALVLKELQTISTLTREDNLIKERMSGQLEDHTRQFDSMIRHMESLLAKKRN